MLDGIDHMPALVVVVFFVIDVTLYEPNDSSDSSQEFLRLMI